MAKARLLTTRQRRIFIIAALTLTVATLGAIVFARRHRLSEWWYIRKLRSTDRLERTAAARALARMRSCRAVPFLIRIVREDKEERLRETIGAGTTLMEWTHERTTTVEQSAKMTPIVYALYQMGECARPAIKVALDADMAPYKACRGWVKNPELFRRMHIWLGLLEGYPAHEVTQIEPDGHDSKGIPAATPP